jgi:hypothetical protein
MLVAEAAQALLLPTKLSANSSVVSVSTPFPQHYALCVHVWRAGHIWEALWGEQHLPYFWGHGREIDGSDGSSLATLLHPIHAWKLADDLLGAVAVTVSGS